MLKILVVDDEKIFRDYVISVINQYEFESEVINESRNGQIALDFVKENKVDIALVDISMPVMDGLTFSLEAKKIQPNMEIILLTGYDEFSYARNALKIGISDYILKPFSEAELKQSLLTVKDKIENRERKEEEGNRLKQAAMQVYSNALISDDFLALEEEIRGVIEQKVLLEQIESLRLVVVEEDFFDRHWQAFGQRNLWRNAVINIWEELADEHYEYLAFCGNSGNVVILLIFTSAARALAYRGDELERLSRIVQDKMKFSVTCALSQAFTSYREVPRYYDHLLRLLEQKFITGTGRVLKEKEYLSSDNQQSYPRINQERIKTALRSNNHDAVYRCIKNVFIQVREQKLNMALVTVLYMELISICLSYLSELEVDIIQIYGKNFVPFSRMKQLHTIDETEADVLALYKKSVDFFAGRQLTRSNVIAQNARGYVLENYQMSSLNVETIARHLYINTSYLRAVFKKEYGETLSNFIFRTRMEKSRELVRSDHIKLAAVADLVGFSDGAYFSKCFKKHYGLTPSEYRILMKHSKEI